MIGGPELIVGFIVLVLVIVVVLFVVRGAKKVLYAGGPNTKPCPDCKKPVSKRAAACPHCGGPLAAA